MAAPKAAPGPAPGPGATVAAPRFAVAACMRNEGAFLLEWVAHYLALGFQRIFVLTNDCDDGTDAMAERLSQLIPLTHIRNEVPEGGFAQVEGMARLKALGDLEQVDWLLHCDADELLYLHMPDPDIGGFVAELPPCDAVAFDWRFVGTELDLWPGGLVVENCPKGSAGAGKPESFSKTLFRPELFESFSDHMPKFPSRPVVVVNSRGEELPPGAMSHPNKSRYIRGSFEHLGWEAAEMRHYALRSKEAFAVKALRGFGINPRVGKYRVGSRFWREADRRDVELAQNPRWLDRLRGGVARLMADPEIAALQARALAVLHEKRVILEAAGRDD